MLLNEDLKKIIEGENFTNFWVMLDYFTLNGYSPMDSFGICLNYFNESKIWEDVAFCRVNNSFTIDHITGTNNLKHNLSIGIIDDSNQHLRTLFTYYHKSVCTGSLHFTNDRIDELEMACKQKFSFRGLPKFMFDYLGETHTKHFGFSIFLEESDIADRMFKRNNLWE